MSTPIQLRVDVDMKELLKAAKAAGKSLDDVIGDFEDLEAESGRSIRAVSADLDDVGDAADDAGHRVEDIGDASDHTGSSISGMGQIAADALKGDIGGAAEGVLDEFADMATAIPGIGLAVGAAALVAGAAFGQMQADAEETRKRTADMFDDMVSGAGVALTETYKLAQAQELLGDEGKRKQIKEYSALLGVDMPTIIDALVGDTGSLIEVQNALTAAIAKTSPTIDYTNTKTYEATRANAELNGKLTALQKELNKTDGAVSAAAGAYQQYAGYAQKVKSDSEGATGAVRTLSSTIGGIPKVTEATVKVRVDASAWNSWRPQQKVATVGGIPSQSPTYGSRQYP